MSDTEDRFAEAQPPIRRVRLSKARFAAGVLIALAVLAAVWFFVVREEGPSPVVGLGPLERQPFTDDGVLPLGPARGVYAPDGVRLAVIHVGELSIAEQGKLRSVTRPGGNVVDVAWFRGSDVLLVAEGPIPTGSLAVVEAGGTVRGAVPLQPSVGFGTGGGMSIAPGNRKAVATAVDRPALVTSDDRRLVEIDLVSGAVRDLTPPGGVQERGPTYVDEDTVFASVGEDAVVIDVGSGQQRIIASEARALGVIGAEWLVYVNDETGVIHARSNTRNGAPTELAKVPDGATAIDVDPVGGRMIVAATEVQADGASVPRLREVKIRQVPATAR